LYVIILFRSQCRWIQVSVSTIFIPLKKKEEEEDRQEEEDRKRRRRTRRRKTRRQKKKEKKTEDVEEMIARCVGITTVRVVTVSVYKYQFSSGILYSDAEASSSSDEVCNTVIWSLRTHLTTIRIQCVH